VRRELPERLVQRGGNLGVQLEVILELLNVRSELFRTSHGHSGCYTERAGLVVARTHLSSLAAAPGDSNGGVAEVRAVASGSRREEGIHVTVCDGAIAPRRWRWQWRVGWALLQELRVALLPGADEVQPRILEKAVDEGRWILAGCERSRLLAISHAAHVAISRVSSFSALRALPLPVDRHPFSLSKSSKVGL